MNAHPDVETLSTYLDRELSRSRRAQIDDHLEVCDSCRVRLSKLQKVVRSLQVLERAAPPPHLGTHLHRLAALQRARPNLAERLELGVSRLNFQSALAPVFAVVVALIVIIYMLSWGLHRQAMERIPVHLEPPESGVETSVSDPVRQILGAKIFHLVDGVWIEEGLDKDTVVEPTPVSDPKVQAWFVRFPDLQQLEALGGPVRLRLEGDLAVEVRFDDP